MSHAVRGRAGAWVLFDPIPLNQCQVELWCDGGGIDTIVLTNGNHERAAAEWRRDFGCRVAGPTGVPWEMEGIRDDREVVLDGWKAIRLEGGAPGETAWWLESESLMVFGDAVVNLAGRGLELLPDKYCQDPKWLRRSLQTLLSHPFESALFAHGDPLPRAASTRIGGLLTGRSVGGMTGGPEDRMAG
jgi:glyoxylase-like metal-dependent hydrolase (beta-lactamase superfamily II)